MSMLTTADVIEIQNLVARYFLKTDNGDADGFMQTWVEPAEFGGYYNAAFGNLETWQAMYEFEKHHVAPGGMANGKRHIAVNLHIEPLSSSEVHVTHDMLVLEVAQPPRLIATGRYDDSLVVRTTAGWRFKRRTMNLDSGFFKLMEQMQGQGQGQGQAGGH